MSLENTTDITTGLKGLVASRVGSFEGLAIGKPLPPIDLGYEYPSRIFIRNTFLDGPSLRPPSFDEFLQERKVQSCPASRTSSGDTYQEAQWRASCARVRVEDR